MKKPTKYDFVKKLVAVGVVVVGAALIVSGAIMLSNHKDEVLDNSKTQASIMSIRAREKVENVFRDYTTYVSTTAGTFAELNSVEDVNNEIQVIKNTQFAEQGLKAARYIKDKHLCWDLPDTLNVTEDLALKYVQNTNKDDQVASYLGINKDKMPEYGTDNEYPVELYEFYSPVKDNLFVDGVAFYFDKNIVDNKIGTEFQNDEALMSVFITDKGNILLGDDNLEKSTVKEMLYEYGVYDQEIINEVDDAISKHKSNVFLCKINGINHVISIEMNEPLLKDLGICEIFECSVLAKTTNDFIDAIVAIIIVFVVIILMTIGILTWTRYRMQLKINNAEKFDTKLQCLNRFGFEKEATQILDREKELYYAIIHIELRHYKYLFENCGESEVNSLLEYLKLTFSKTCKIEEVYGYMGEGEFLMVLHAKNKEELIDKLKIHSFLAKEYKGAHKFSVALKYGIYERQINEHTKVSDMVDFAIEANNAIVKATVENVDMQFNFYDDELRKIRLINEDMELRQEQALKDGEFQVFYQAKYNLKTHKQDGAEALVRWYDPKTGEYNKPALFMPLFESNGFIEKLDKYVYTKVCEYLSYSLASGRKVFPVSVNVSRITATQPDFVDFYAKTKKKYGLSNGALTIEFTESFAYENYDVLKDIVDKLHKAGFQTSIDDFGCGYSSYRILKELPMDEIKLDKFFIDYSENPDRINSIFESVIALAKKLNMKVTQEGVEKEEDVELLKKLGCDVIQGYIYSHPLSLTDYLHFVENTKDHNL